MLPLTLVATGKLVSLLTANDALSQTVAAAVASAGLDVVPISSSNVFASYAPPQMGDLDLQLTYPRVVVYATQVANRQREKFRPFSGTVQIAAEVWASAALEQLVERSLHFYASGVGSVLQANIGDWGNGCRYSGIYEIHIQAPKTGGFGFVQSAKVICTLDASFS